MTTRSQNLNILFFLTAIAYCISIPWLPWTGDFVLKAIPALTLAALAFFNTDGSAKIWLVAGFILSAGGDIALSFAPTPQLDTFVIGLGCFLFGHLCYIFAFSRKVRYRKERLGIIIGIVALSGAMAVILAPKLGEMAIPVFVYMTVITVMGIYSTINAQARSILIAGAVLFILSDGMIAINKFVEPISWSKYFIMVTYFGGQYLIGRSFWREKS